MKAKIFFLFYIFLLSVSCYNDRMETGTPKGDECTVKIPMVLPPALAPSTYGITELDENYIRLVDVLVFDENDIFLYQARASRVMNSENAVQGNQKNVEVTLSRTKGTNKVKVIMVANTRQYLVGIEEGDTKEEVMKKVVYEFPEDNVWRVNSSYDFEPIPMWGETDQLVSIDGSDLPVIKMVRALAHIEIGVNFTEDGSTSDYQGFNISKVYVYNGNNRGYVIPEAGNYDDSDFTITDPSVPAGDVSYGEPAEIYVGNSRHVIRQIYMGESYAGVPGQEDQAPCIVLEATMSLQNQSSQTVTYYRIDFVQTIEGSRQFIPILRNHRYRFNIKDIKRTGYNTKEEAFAGTSFNNTDDNDDLTVDLDIIGQSSTYITDGIYYLSLPESYNGDELYRYITEDSIFRLPIMTNHPDGWKARIDNHNSSENPMTVLNDSGPWGEKGYIEFKMARLDIWTNFYIYVSAGRMHAEIYYYFNGYGTEHPGYDIQVPADFNGNGNLEIQMAAVELPFATTWNMRNNLYQDVIDHEIPPYGSGRQYSPPHPNSCAALEHNGYYNWRMPTIAEVRACLDYYGYPPNNNMYMMYTAETSGGDPEYFITLTYMSQGSYTQNPKRKITEYNYDLGERCVRTVDEEFFIRTGRKIVIDNQTEKYEVLVYSKVGLQWQKGNAEFDEIFSAAVQSAKEVEHGYTMYTITLTPKTYTKPGEPERSSSMTVSGGDGTNQTTILIERERGEGFIVPDSYSNFGYDLVVMEYSFADDYSKTWYEYANVPSGVNSMELPPAGPQVTNSTGQYGSIPGSCASVTSGGYSDWRLPTIDEANTMIYYFIREAGGTYQEAQTLYNFTGSIPSSTSYINGSEPDYFYYTYLSNPGKHGHPKSSQGGGFGVRCVRTGKDFYAISNAVNSSGTAGDQVTFKVFSHNGLNKTPVKGYNYDKVIQSIQFKDPDNTSPYYQVIVTTKAAEVNPYEASFTLSSTTGGYTETLTVIQPSTGYSMPARESDLNYPLVIAPTDLSGSPVWYYAANVPQGHEAFDIPPLGAQVTDQTGQNGSHPQSCAALTTDGRSDWRMPLISELKAIYKYYLKTRETFGMNIHNYYWVANTQPTDYSRAGQYYMYNSQTNWTPKTYGGYPTRCVRTGTDFYGTPGVFELESDAADETNEVLIISEYGLNTTTYGKDENFDKMVSSVSFAAAGTNRWIMTVNTKAYPGDTGDYSTVITLQSTTGGYSFPVTINQKGDSFVVPKSFSGLDYDLQFALNDLSGTVPWYLAANVPDGHDSQSVPPNGVQVSNDTGVNGSRPGSCASLTENGYTDWRMPTIAEMNAIWTYVEQDMGLGDNGSWNSTKYGGSRSNYWTAETYTSNLSYAYYVRAYSRPYQSRASKGGYYYVRCVRTR